MKNNISTTKQSRTNPLVHLRSAIPEAGIEGKDKYLQPTDTAGCNYLSLPLIPVYGRSVLILCHKLWAALNDVATLKTSAIYWNLQDKPTVYLKKWLAPRTWPGLHRWNTSKSTSSARPLHWLGYVCLKLDLWSTKLPQRNSWHVQNTLNIPWAQIELHKIIRMEKSYIRYMVLTAFVSLAPLNPKNGMRRSRKHIFQMWFSIVICLISSKKNIKKYANYITNMLK